MWYVWITFANNFKVMFHFASSLWCFFYCFTTTLSMLLLQQHVFNRIKITFFVTFKLRIKVTLLLRYFLVYHYEILCIIWQPHFSRFLKHVFLITLEIRRLLICCNYVRKYGTITLRVWSSFLDYFFVVRLHNLLK